MKMCPNCRMEARADAGWCWHCGFSYEEAEAKTASACTNERHQGDDSEQDRGTGTYGPGRSR